jgi:hypothetical protein
MDGPAVQQQLFCQGGFPRVRVEMMAKLRRLSTSCSSSALNPAIAVPSAINPVLH